MTDTNTIDLGAGADFLLRTRNDFPSAGMLAGDLLGVRKQPAAEDGQTVIVKAGEDWKVSAAPVDDGAEVQGRVVWFRRDLP